MSDTVYSFTCGATTLVGKEGYAVKAASGLVELSAASIRAIGVVVAGAAAGEQVSVALAGSVAPVKLGGTVYAGDILAIGAGSTFTASTPTDGDIVGAVALQDGVSGDLINALIVDANRYEAG